jgi:hypothetical protein
MRRWFPERRFGDGVQAVVVRRETLAQSQRTVAPVSSRCQVSN